MKNEDENVISDLYIINWIKRSWLNIKKNFY